MKKLFLMLFIGMFFFACNKTDKEVDESKSSCSIDDVGFLGFNDGVFHNDLVNLIIEEWNICPGSPTENAQETNRILNTYSENIAEDYNFDHAAFLDACSSVDFVSVFSTTSVSPTVFATYNFSTALESKLEGMGMPTAGLVGAITGVGASVQRAIP